MYPTLDTAPWTFLLIVYPTLCGWYSTLNFSVNCVPYTLWLIQHLELLIVYPTLCDWTFLLIVYPTLCGWYSTLTFLLFMYPTLCGWYSTLNFSVNCVPYTLWSDTAPWTFLLIVYPTLCGWYSTLNFSVNCVHPVNTLWLIQHLELFC